MSKLIISLSGGLDSLTLLDTYLDAFTEIHCVFFNYGSKHNILEQKAFEDIIAYYQQKKFSKADIIAHVIDLRTVFSDFKSALLTNTEEAIPTGEYTKANMSSTVVPCRNMIFSSILAGLAVSLEANAVALGMHSGDHFIYPDCRPEFVTALKATIHAATDHKVKVLAPLLEISKSHIVKILIERGTAPIHLTRSCYTTEEVACGQCGTCTERLKAFALNEVKDPIPYKK